MRWHFFYSAVLANADGVDLWALQHEIFTALIPAFRNAPYAPPKTTDTGAKGKFNPPVDERSLNEGGLSFRRLAISSFLSRRRPGWTERP